MDIISLLVRLAFTAVFYFLPDVFIHSAIKASFKKNPRKATKRYWLVNIALFLITGSGFLLMQFMSPDIVRINLYFFGIFISLLFAKLIMAIVLLIAEDSWRIPYSLFTRKRRSAALAPEKAPVLINRRTFIARTALVAGVLPFSGFMYGIFKGRYRFTIHEETLYFADLPPAFDGFTITQLSDLHMGSWDTNTKYHIQTLVDEVNTLASDAIFFTGDIVNSRADEMNGWYEILRQLKAPLGKISILGNHDYGDYVNWKTPQEKETNLQLVKNIHPAIGFDLLLNEHTRIEKNGEYIFVAGVENWGKGDFPKFGDLDAAYKDIPKDAFTILLSHDPSHWEAKVLQHERLPHITLSGHTHGFQMGIEVPAFRFSPSQFIYPQWAGLYTKQNTHIYVNRGLGTVGYPGRLGIWPEITRITLRKK
jgi:predicted MPP superfamily phosphohydrolase